MIFLFRRIPYLVNNSNTFRVFRCGFTLAKLIHTEREVNNNAIIINEIRDSLRKGLNWDALSRKFNSVELSNVLVEEVLLDLKEPNDAKRALGFFHWSAQRKNLKHRVRIYCIAIHILVRARLIIDARALLESVLKKNKGCVSGLSVVESLLDTYRITCSSPYVFDLLVQCYSKLRMLDVAYDVCCHLEESGVNLSIISFNTLIHIVHKSDQCNLGWKVYEHMIRIRMYPDEVTIRNMVDLICKEGALQKYVDILDRIHGKRCSPVIIVNTGLIIRIIEEGRVEEGMVLLKRMLQKNMILDTVAFSLTVHAKINIGNLDSAWEVYEEMVKRGFKANSFVYTSFIRAYCRKDEIEEANRLKQEMEDLGLKPYDETFSFLIEGCAKAGGLDKSLRYCEEMVERGLVPSCLAFNEMLGRLSEIGDAKKADAILTRILDKGFLPDDLTYSYLIAAYGKVGDVQEARKLYYEMEFRSLTPGTLVFTALIRSLCNCGKLEEAKKFLQVMKDRSLSSSVSICETLIASHFEKGDEMGACQI